MKVPVVILVMLVLLIWIGTDLVRPKKVDFRKFDPKSLATLDCRMWKSYYEKKPLLLFWQLAKLTRQQAHAPFWRSFLIASYASKAAFVFKDGTKREEYRRALTPLEKYYDQLNALSIHPFDTQKTAQLELEWWIVRRERVRHPPAEWADLQARVAAQLYGLPAKKFEKYARLRTEAMLYRDQKGESISDTEWKQVQNRLLESWKSLSQALAE